MNTLLFQHCYVEGWRCSLWPTAVPSTEPAFFLNQFWWLWCCCPNRWLQSRFLSQPQTCGRYATCWCRLRRPYQRTIASLRSARSVHNEESLNVAFPVQSAVHVDSQVSVLLNRRHHSVWIIPAPPLKIHNHLFCLVCVHVSDMRWLFPEYDSSLDSASCPSPAAFGQRVLRTVHLESSSKNCPSPGELFHFAFAQESSSGRYFFVSWRKEGEQSAADKGDDV